jgi:hypothetical protein
MKRPDAAALPEEDAPSAHPGNHAADGASDQYAAAVPKKAEGSAKLLPEKKAVVAISKVGLHRWSRRRTKKGLVEKEGESFLCVFLSTCPSCGVLPWR